MTFRKLLDKMQQFAAKNPDHEALDQQVVVRVGVPNDDTDEDLHVGGLQSAVVDAGCTDEFALVLDADQDPDEDDEAQESSDNAEDSVDGAITDHPPIASYALGQSVTFYPGRGDHWHPGIVTRLESVLHTDGSAGYTIFVSSTVDLPSGEWKRACAYRFENRDGALVSPAKG
jgi:hypothetical protein